MMKLEWEKNPPENSKIEDRNNLYGLLIDELKSKIDRPCLTDSFIKSFQFDWIKLNDLSIRNSFYLNKNLKLNKR